MKSIDKAVNTELITRDDRDERLQGLIARDCKDYERLHRLIVEIARIYKYKDSLSI